MSRPRAAGPIAGWLTGTAVAALSLLALVFVLGGQALDEPPPGLPDLRLPSSALIVSRWVTHIVAVAAVGLALLGSGVLGARRPDAVAAVVPLGFVWTSASVFGAAFTSWQLGSAELLDSLQVRGLLVQAALAALGALVAAAGSRWTLVVLLLALMPPLVTGHVLTAGSPLLAGVALVVHVVAAALWVGGLFALAWLAFRGRSGWGAALPTYSRLALGCVVALALSGVGSTLTRTTSVGDLLTTTYGTVVLLKATLLGGLAAIGWLQRQRVASARRPDVRAFVLLAGAELALMALAFALATGLAHTPPPT